MFHSFHGDTNTACLLKDKHREFESQQSDKAVNGIQQRVGAMVSLGLHRRNLKAEQVQ
jgi:hypothetical protein